MTSTNAAAAVTHSEAADQLSFARQVIEIEARALHDLAGRLDDSLLDAAALLLDTTGNVIVSGIGKAGLIGNKIQATLASTGTPSYGLHPVEALHGDLGMVAGDDVVIALSKSGGSELVELLPRLKGLGCKVILLTGNVRSRAAEYADHVLDIGDAEEACPLKLAPSSSTTAMVALGDALALTVMDIKAIKPEQYAGYHPGGALGRFLMKCGEIMRTEANCPSVPDSATLGECYQAILDAPRRAGAACMVDSAGKLVGIVTQGDFFRLFNHQDHSPDRAVTEVMTRNPKAVRVQERVTVALGLMRQHAIDELPVVDEEGKLVGLIDVQDLLDRGFSRVDGT